MQIKYSHSEGRCTPNGGVFYYDYTIKDHLGNARVNFRANGTAVVHLEEMHYYPFGMLMEGLGSVSPVNDCTYNGKEVNDDGRRHTHRHIQISHQNKCAEYGK